MNDAEYDAEFARVKALRDRWHYRIVPPDWKVSWDFWREPLPTRADEEISSGRVAADCLANWRYMAADIRIDLSHTRNLSADELEEIVVHEYCHIFVNELRPAEWTQDRLDHEEHAVQTLTRRFLSLRDDLLPSEIGD